MGFKEFIPPVLISAYQQWKRSRPVTYKIGKLEIMLPKHHLLPWNQKIYRLYDRFLPILVKHLDPENTIIDVGANVGDSAASIIQNCSNKVICIEPSDEFFTYLKKNIELINSNQHSGNNEVVLKKYLVGTNSFSGVLEHKDGTAQLIPNSVNQDGDTHTPLDDLVDLTTGIELVKVDTDGFDFDVLMSSEKILKDSEPILFWENDIRNSEQNQGYMKLYKFLSEIGYSYLSIFDNFGNLLLEDSDFDTLRKINRYIAGQYTGTQQTFFYTDVLATTKKHKLKAIQAIEEYKREWMSTPQ